ncbi:ClbS/DfsB family four-helix bundle protein [Shewanella baltica]|uniref:ClbS/DfsB family four-helix bundle protein n=1 Tax=Shewanella baltica TaxID=62322 RepID=UPI0039B0F363
MPQSKQKLELAIYSVFPKLMADYRSIPAQMSRVCSIEGNIKGTQISVIDTVAYLIGWGKLVLKWYELTSQALPVDFPDTGYKWNQLGLLAKRFHHEYSQWQYTDLLDEYEMTMEKLSALIASLSDHPCKLDRGIHATNGHLHKYALFIQSCVSCYSTNLCST